MDDGSCEYPPDETPGCTDPDALNHNPDATLDDGSCQYEVPGCTEREAMNFDPAATTDDGSCVYPPIPSAVIDCFTLEFAMYKVTIANTGPVGEVGYSTDLETTVVTLGSMANGATETIYLDPAVNTLYVYADELGTWGSPLVIDVNIKDTPLCEEDPMSVEPFCSYVDLGQPHGWRVNNLNSFAVSFTWQYGSLGSPAPIALSAGSSYDFTTPDQPGESMLIFVDGVLLASSEPASCPGFLTLELVGICSNEPASTHGWRANNYNAFEVSAEWRVVGTSLTGLLTIPASSAILFTTPVEEGDMAQLYYGGVFQDDAGAASDCVPPENPPETPPETPPLVIIPVTAPAAPILIPVTGVADDLGNMAPAGMFSLGLGFFGLGTVLHGVSRKRAREQ
jgi:hypothetical protein